MQTVPSKLARVWRRRERAEKSRVGQTLKWATQPKGQNRFATQIFVDTKSAPATVWPMDDAHLSQLRVMHDNSITPSECLWLRMRRSQAADLSVNALANSS